MLNTMHIVCCHKFSQSRFHHAHVHATRLSTVNWLHRQIYIAVLHTLCVSFLAKKDFGLDKIASFIFRELSAYKTILDIEIWCIHVRKVKVQNYGNARCISIHVAVTMFYTL